MEKEDYGMRWNLIRALIQYYDQRGTNMPGYKKIYEKYHKILNEG